MPDVEITDEGAVMRAVMDAARVVRQEYGHVIAGFDSHRLASLVNALRDAGWMLVPASDLAAVTAERDRLRRIGDLLQSDASRLAQYVLGGIPPIAGPAPYEVRSAALSAQYVVGQWTDLRRGAALSSSPVDPKSQAEELDGSPAVQVGSGDGTIPSSHHEPGPPPIETATDDECRAWARGASGPLLPEGEARDVWRSAAEQLWMMASGFALDQPAGPLIVMARDSCLRLGLNPTVSFGEQWDRVWAPSVPVGEDEREPDSPAAPDVYTGHVFSSNDFCDVCGAAWADAIRFADCQPSRGVADPTEEERLRDLLAEHKTGRWDDSPAGFAANCSCGWDMAASTDWVRDAAIRVHLEKVAADAGLGACEHCRSVPRLAFNCGGPGRCPWEHKDKPSRDPVAVPERVETEPGLDEHGQPMLCVRCGRNVTLRDPCMVCGCAAYMPERYVSLAAAAEFLRSKGQRYTATLLLAEFGPAAAVSSPVEEEGETATRGSKEQCEGCGGPSADCEAMHDARAQLLGNPPHEAVTAGARAVDMDEEEVYDTVAAVWRVALRRLVPASDTAMLARLLKERDVTEELLRRAARHAMSTSEAGVFWALANDLAALDAGEEPMGSGWPRWRWTAPGAAVEEWRDGPAEETGRELGRGWEVEHEIPEGCTGYLRGDPVTFAHEGRCPVHPGAYEIDPAGHAAGDSDAKDGER